MTVQAVANDAGRMRTVATALPNIGAITGAAAPAKNSDNLFSYRAGLVYKPQDNASIYLAYGNSKTPSKASVNGTCTATSAARTAMPRNMTWRDRKYVGV